VGQVDLTVRVGRKYAIYLPKGVVERLGISEGDEAILTVRGEEIVIKPVKRLLRSVKAWSSVSFEEVEEVGESLSREILGKPSS